MVFLILVAALASATAATAEMQMSDGLTTSQAVEVIPDGPIVEPAWVNESALSERADTSSSAIGAVLE